MKSPFNPSDQEENADLKIIAALERISQAFRVLLWLQSKEPGLSPIQIQILIYLRFHPVEKCTVSYLSQEFNLTKATVSDSIKNLLLKSLIFKKDSDTDTRSYTISLTSKGKQVVEKTAGFASVLERPVAGLSAKQKEKILTALLSLIHQLNIAGVISIQRMCFACSNYSSANGAHFCRLLNKQLDNSGLRLDCPDFVPLK